MCIYKYHPSLYISIYTWIYTYTMNNINDIQRYNNLVMEIMCEPEFKPGGFVYKHLEENKSDQAGLLSRPRGGVFTLAQPLLEVS